MALKARRMSTTCADRFCTALPVLPLALRAKFDEDVSGSILSTQHCSVTSTAPRQLLLPGLGACRSVSVSRTLPRSRVPACVLGLKKIWRFPFRPALTPNTLDHPCFLPCDSFLIIYSWRHASWGRKSGDVLATGHAPDGLCSGGERVGLQVHPAQRSGATVRLLLGPDAGCGSDTPHAAPGPPWSPLQPGTANKLQLKHSLPRSGERRPQAPISQRERPSLTRCCGCLHCLRAV